MPTSTSSTSTTTTTTLPSDSITIHSRSSIDSTTILTIHITIHIPIISIISNHTTIQLDHLLNNLCLINIHYLHSQPSYHHSSIH